jgi:hypothetical protein
MSLPNDINSVVSQYQQVMSWLHTSTSRDIVLIYEPVQSGCPNHVGFNIIEKRAFPTYNQVNPFSQTTPTVISSLGISGILNIPFSGGETCPVCNGFGGLQSPTSGTIKARIQWRNAERERDADEIKLLQENADVRIKVTGNDVALVERAIRFHVDGVLCEKNKAGVAFGLRDIFEYHYYLRKVQ